MAERKLVVACPPRACFPEFRGVTVTTDHADRPNTTTLQRHIADLDIQLPQIVLDVNVVGIWRAEAVPGLFAVQAGRRRVGWVPGR